MLSSLLYSAVLASRHVFNYLERMRGCGRYLGVLQMVEYSAVNYFSTLAFLLTHQKVVLLSFSTYCKIIWHWNNQCRQGRLKAITEVTSEIFLKM